MVANNASRWSARVRIALVLLVGLSGVLRAQEPIRVRYRSAELVYLDAGLEGGLDVGTRLSVVRDGSTIAELEVVFAAESSSSCKVLFETSPVKKTDRALPLTDVDARSEDNAARPANNLVIRDRSADRVTVDGGESRGLSIGDVLEVERRGRVIGRLNVIAVSSFSAVCGVLSESEALLIGDEVRLEGASDSRIEIPRRPLPTVTLPAPPGASTRGARSGVPHELALEARPVTPLPWQPAGRLAAATTMRMTGTVNLGWELFAESGRSDAVDSERSEARINLRLRDIGGLPYEFRLRLRSEQLSRDPFDTGFDTFDPDRNRFYEASLTYDPPQGLFAYRLGRIPSNAFTGAGYLDGFLGQMALSSSLEVGGFIGSDARIPGFEVDTQRQKFGAFARFTSPMTDSALPWEVVVAGIQENGVEGVSRQYLTLQTRYDNGSRWSFFQRAEMDINNGWRKELSSSGFQLSNFSLSATGELLPNVRLGLSYNLFEQYRTEETRRVPEDLFNDLQRQGVRMNLQIGRPRSLNLSLNAGLRDQQGEADRTLSYGVVVRHPRLSSLDLGLTLNALGFSNQMTDGYLVSLRTSRRLPGGHQLDLTLGRRHSASTVFDAEPATHTQWARLGGWFELPRNLFATFGFEGTRGDELRGTRLRLGLGYRF